LGAPGAAPAGATINVNSVNTPQGHKAFAVYHAPLDFVRAGVPGDANARSRNLTLTTVFTPQAGAVQNGTRDLVIERPPVVLCHGLWSNPATWNGFAPLIGSALFDFTRADYSNNNAGRFAVNRFQTRSNATAARQAKNRRGIASAQVDWIGHSMGGLLPRSFAATGFFRRPDNFNRGDLHKLITVNTPHWGSPMANLLLGIRGTFFVGDLLIVGMERMNMSVVGGAIDDLAEGSAALGAIGATPVRSHSICGIGGSQAIGVADIGFGVAAALSPPPWNGLFRLLRMVSFATTASVYRFNEHDFIVLLPSQQGGLGGATTTTLGGLGSHHTAVTSFAPAANQCITLLNAPTTGATFAAVIPAPNLTPPDPGDGGSPTPAPAGMGINFTTAPSTVNPGANVTLSVSAFGGYAPTTVLFVGSLQSFAVDETPPFSVAITVPPESIGEFSVMAIAIDALDRVATTPPLAFPVQVTATLTGLTSFVDRLYLTAPGQESSVTIYGTYSDGVPRIVSAAGLGTTFLSSDPMVATVSPLGEVTAVGEGTCAVIAQHGGLEVSFGVFVSWQADLTLVGEGCATSVGVPVLGSSGGAPVLGNANFALTAGNAPVPSFVLFALQVGPAVTPGVPVPGAPPCARAHLLPHDLIATIASPTGSASHPLAIPASSALAGTVLTAQLAVWDPALVGFGLPIGTSPALQVTIGR
jgi:pimeloyl-ACP methyl ester carboxylesterase